MKETVTDPLLFFLASILFGVCLQAIYDIIRGIRRVFYHKSVFLFIEDIGFGIFTAVMAFIFLCTTMPRTLLWRTMVLTSTPYL